jgi:hypothetical protein
VVTSPEVTGSGQVSLIPDLRLVRSALLYADRVELISPGLAMLGTFDSLKDAGKVDPVKLVATLDDATLARLGWEGTAQEVRSSFTRLSRVLALPERLRRRKMSLEQEAELNGHLDELRQGMTEASTSVNDVLEQAGAPDLTQAVEAGALTVDVSGFDVDAETDQQVAWLQGMLLRRFQDPSAHLLLDDRLVQLVGELPETALSDINVGRATRTRTGTGLIEQLPAFPDAEMGEVLALRDELTDGRARYRGAVTNLTARLQATVLDEALPSEIEDLWRDEVQPSLRDMQQTVSGSRLAQEVAGRVLTDYRTTMTGGLLVTLDHLTHLSPAQTVAVATPLTANVMWQAVGQFLSHKDAIRRHELFYLFDVNRRLSV